jgi:sugar phosphate isomerase/epimerase
MAPAASAFFGGGDGEQPDVAEMLANIDLTPVYDGIHSLADYAELVSLKAHTVAEDGTVGPVDLERALRILAAHGYTGPLSLEYEGTGGDPWAKSARILDVARTALDSIKKEGR